MVKNNLIILLYENLIRKNKQTNIHGTNFIISTKTNKQNLTVFSLWY